MNKIITAFAANTVFANIIMVIILLAGIMAANTMNRESMPDMALDKISISVSYPGADPEEVEEGVSRKIEDAIDGLNGIDDYKTVSAEGMATASIDVKDGYDPEVLLSRIRNEVDAITTFPEDSETPSVTRPQIQDAVMSLALTSDMSERRMKEWANDIKRELQQIPSVSQVEISGTRAYEIRVTVGREQLRKYGLSLPEVANAVKNSSLNRSGGLVKTGIEEIRVRTVGRKYTGKELGSVTVVAGSGGERITLAEIAGIEDGFTENNLAMTVNGNPAVLINIFSADEDTIDISDAVKKYLGEKNPALPEGSAVTVMSDNTEEIRSGLDELSKNAVAGLILVFILLWLFMNTRVSFWAGMGIPISLLGGLAIVAMVGQTLNNITLFGLIMVLGIVADDAIIVGEAIYVHRKNGASPMESITRAISEVGMPVLAAVLTTMAAFIPLFNIDGTMGKFIVALPIAVVACLSISLIESLLLLPAHLSDLPGPEEDKKPKNRLLAAVDRFHTASINSMDLVSEKLYRPALAVAVRYRYICLCLSVAALLLTFGLINGGFIKFDVFPQKASSTLLASVEFPEGTPFGVTRQAVRRVEKAIRTASEGFETLTGEPLIENILATYGQSASQDEGQVDSASPHVGGIRVSLLDPEKSGIHSREIIKAWQKETGSIPGIQNLEFSTPQGGPPGMPVQIGITGPSLSAINSAAEKTVSRLAQIKGVTQVITDNAPGKNELTFRLRPQADALGLTVADLAEQIYAGYYGEEAVRIQRGDDDVKIRIIYPGEERSTKTNLKEIRIKTPEGHEVPLTNVATVSFGPGYSSITRENGLRQVTVSADLDPNLLVANEVTDMLSAGFFQELENSFPGIRISLDGDAKRSSESFGSLTIWIPLALLLVYMIVATLFRSYIQPGIIMFTIPFGLIGAVMGHMLMGHMLSLLSIFGMVALTGVVVNDAIVLIERINMNLGEKMPFFDAVILGGTRRFRAVMLTSLSTVGGLLPLMLETGQQSQMLIPMSISLAFGVAFATVLTLVLIPCLFVILNDMRLFTARLTGRNIKTREEAEPAFTRNTAHEPAQQLFASSPSASLIAASPE